jgi:hypothetical protein
MAFLFVQWSLILTSAILILFDGVVLYKVFHGSKYKVLVWLVAGLLVSNLCYLGEGIAIALNNLEQQSTDTFRYIAAVLAPIGDLLFGEVHWYLAIFYLKIATNTPKVIDGCYEKLKSYKGVFIVGVVWNAVWPCAELYTWVASISDAKELNWGYSIS